MAEFILVTEWMGGEQLLIHTEDITTVTQKISDGGVTTTYLMRRQYAMLRVRETIAQLTMLLSSPIGRHYAPTAMGGWGYSSGPVPVGPNQFI